MQNPEKFIPKARTPTTAQISSLFCLSLHPAFKGGVVVVAFYASRNKEDKMKRSAMLVKVKAKAENK